MNKKISGYYFITDSSLSKAGNLRDVLCAAKAGVKIIQYRNKSGSTKELYEEALRLKSACGKSIFLINDRVDIAFAVDAGGVHLGQDDMPCRTARKILGRNKIIGVTARNVREAKKARKDGADYIGVSPVFGTATKSDAGKPVGTGMVRKIKKAVSVPVVAIGGINLSNAPGVVKAGADGLCAISAVVAKSNPAAEIRKFQKLF